MHKKYIYTIILEDKWINDIILIIIHLYDDVTYIYAILTNSIMLDLHS